MVDDMAKGIVARLPFLFVLCSDASFPSFLTYCPLLLARCMPRKIVGVLVAVGADDLACINDTP